MRLRRSLPLLGSLLLVAVGGTHCTGGQETAADTLSTRSGGPAPAAGTTPGTSAPAPSVDTRQKLAEISPAIPLYPDTSFSADLTRRDEVTVRNQFGSDAQVYTLATGASFPEVWHYYVTYLAQFRGYNPPPPYPQASQNWRTMQVHLNEAMQDPFVPGDALNSTKQVILQIAETEADPPTVIRYIVTSHPVGDQPVAIQ